MPPKLITSVTFAALLAGGCTSGGSSPAATPTGAVTATSTPAGTTIIQSPYHVTLHPADFSASVTNPWFPLKPGTTYIYRGTKDKKQLRDIFVVTNQTAVIDGVSCVVVSDKGYLNGILSERTKDYYTQDNQGNVWCFGEDTAELNSNGQITSTEGSWRTGVSGAQPGIFMDANPSVGLSHRQEY